MIRKDDQANGIFDDFHGPEAIILANLSDPGSVKDQREKDIIKNWLTSSPSDLARLKQKATTMKIDLTPWLSEAL